VVLVHGEPEPQETLRRLLVERGFPNIHVGVRGETIEL
jgi:hypothetical protein